MRKLIRAVIICAMIVTLMIALTLAVYAASSVIYVTADKTEAEPGETVNFTVSLGPVSDMGTILMKLDIPDGLTYVKGSGKLAAGLKSELGYDMLDFTESSLIINGAASAADYSSSSDTTICTFSCTVNDGFKGKAEVGLTNLEFCSCKTWEDHTGDYSVSKAVISVGQDAEQSGSADPADASKQSGSNGSSSSSGQAGDSSSSQSGSGSGTEASQPGNSDGSSAQASDSDGQADSGDISTDDSKGMTPNDQAEEEHSSSAVWIIAVVAAAAVLIALVLLFRRKKKSDA